MRKNRCALPSVLLLVGLFAVAGCSDGEPASGVGIPGAAPAVVPVTPATSASTTVPTSLAPADAPVPTTTVSIVAPTTAPGGATTIAATPPTTAAIAAPPTTAVNAPTTTVPATTTTVLVYKAEPATGGLVVGGEGPRTLKLQQDLIRLGHLPPGADDGLYGPGTAGGVRRFQEAASLVIDGVAGPITLDAIINALNDAAADA